MQANDAELSKAIAALTNNTPPRHPSPEQVWLMAWCAVASAANSTSKERTTEWANHCLQEFTKTFHGRGEV